MTNFKKTWKESEEDLNRLVISFKDGIDKKIVTLAQYSKDCHI